MMLSNQLAEQEAEIHGIAIQLGINSNAQKNEKIAEFENLIMRFNDMAEDLEFNEQINLKELGNLLRDIRTFINEMIKNWLDNWFRDIALQIIMNLIPAYTFLLSEYLKSYYFQKQRIPKNYKMLMSLYDELADKGFETHILDYYLLEKKIPSLSAQDIIDAKLLLGEKGRLQVEDQLSLVKELEVPERYEKFEKELDQVIQKQADQLACSPG